MVGVRVSVLQVKFCYRYLCCLSLYHWIHSRYECILVVATILVYTCGRWSSLKESHQTKPNQTMVVKWEKAQPCKHDSSCGSWILFLWVVGSTMCGNLIHDHWVGCCCKDVAKNSYQAIWTWEWAYDNHLGFIYPFSRYCSLFFLKSFCLLEYRICHLPQWASVAWLPMGSGLTFVSLILLLQLMGKVLSDLGSSKVRTKQKNLVTRFSPHDDTFCSKISCHNDLVLKQFLILWEEIL